mmetsp:Transcript_7801/g.35370  ORF Transcript_7801/g.35370 Transcript_7801/m.35370 type:complete len:314 (-) Transcript_7801:1124-2065(-)
MSLRASSRTIARPFQLLNLAAVDGSHEWFTRHRSEKSACPLKPPKSLRLASKRSSASAVSSNRISPSMPSSSSSSSSSPSYRSSPPHRGLPAAASSASRITCALSAIGSKTSSVGFAASAPSYSSTRNSFLHTLRMGPSIVIESWFMSQTPSRCPTPSRPSRLRTSGNRCRTFLTSTASLKASSSPASAAASASRATLSSAACADSVMRRIARFASRFSAPVLPEVSHHGMPTKARNFSVASSHDCPAATVDAIEPTTLAIMCRLSLPEKNSRSAPAPAAAARSASSPPPPPAASSRTSPSDEKGASEQHNTS